MQEHLMMQKMLLKWYDEEKRDLPWRRTKDPYKIWLSEIMCQQTQVATVIAYYERFIEVFPDVYKLAEAKEDQVYKLWEGLGYYSRAARLIQCAQVIVDKYEGTFPKRYEELLKLPGIGPYTAGAIGSICFELPVTAIDGNVMRVFARRLLLDIDVGDAKARNLFQPYVEKTLPNRVGDYNQALMELGARICTPQSPSCDLCPIGDSCLAKGTDQVTKLPYRKAKASKKTEKVLVAYIQHGMDILIEKRGPEGLLANLWGFPALVVEDNEDSQVLEDYLKEAYDLEVEVKEVMVAKKHVFTHKIWEMHLLRVTCQEPKTLVYPEVVWINQREITKYPLPTAFTKLLDF